MLLRADSQLVFAAELLNAGLVPFMGVEGVAEDVWRPTILVIRSRGTRVCIFCSKLRTLARISDTIWTPLFLAPEPVDETVLVLTVDGYRATGGFAITRGLDVDGDEYDVVAVDRSTLTLDEVLSGV